VLRIGIDLGGTKTEGVLLAEDGSVRTRRRVPTPTDRGYEAVLETVVGLVAGLRGEVAGAPCRVGVGIPGCVDAHSGLVKNSNSTGLIGRPLQADLAARLGDEVRVANDANCFALAEACAGAGRGRDLVFGIILGTGVGGGLVIDGAVRTGLQGIAGEWGHSPLEDHDPQAPLPPRCYCGQRGCVETRLSGPALERDYARLAGRRRGAREVLERAARGEDAAVRAHERYLAFFGEGVARLIHVLDPDVVVLGGGMSNDERLYDDGRRAVARVLFNDVLETPILRNALGDSAGVFGAAWLWGGRRVGPPEGTP
jgi:fructokinase